MTEFRVCPACGYGRGFHLFFKESGTATRLGLICPNCGQSYDPGWELRPPLRPEPEPGASFSNRSEE